MLKHNRGLMLKHNKSRPCAGFFVSCPSVWYLCWFAGLSWQLLPNARMFATCEMQMTIIYINKSIFAERVKKINYQADKRRLASLFVQLGLK